MHILRRFYNNAFSHIAYLSKLTDSHFIKLSLKGHFLDWATHRQGFLLKIQSKQVLLKENCIIL